MLTTIMSRRRREDARVDAFLGAIALSDRYTVHPTWTISPDGRCPEGGICAQDCAPGHCYREQVRREAPTAPHPMGPDDAHPLPLSLVTLLVLP